MTYGKRSTMPTKLIGLTVVVAGVVLGAREHCKDDSVVDNSNDQVVVYPVDRNELSQRVLPFDVREVKFQNPASERLSLSTIAANPGAADLADAMDADAKSPSVYELKLSDQQAWGSLQRQVDLIPKEVQSSVRAADVDIAGSGQPIVPGINDPHLWYGDSTVGELASATSPRSNADSILPSELTESSFDFSAPIEIALLPPLEKTKPRMSKPVESTPAPKVRTARAWETGRY